MKDRHTEIYLDKCANWVHVVMNHCLMYSHGLAVKE